MTSRAGIRKMTGTLQEVKVIIISPGTDVALPDKIKGADQLHPLKICAVELWHHRLDLRTVKHAHQDCLDHVIIMMPQRDLIAAKLLCLTV